MYKTLKNTINNKKGNQKRIELVPKQHSYDSLGKQAKTKDYLIFACGDLSYKINKGPSTMQKLEGSIVQNLWKIQTQLDFSTTF